MGSLPGDTAISSEQLIEKQSLDSLPVLATAISYVGTTYTIKDLKALRLTCKLLKQLVDPWFKKLEINMSMNADTGSAIAASSSLGHITDLEIVCEWEGFNSEPNDLWERHKQSILSILKQTAPRLERLNIHAIEEAEYSMFSRLLRNHQFPKLKSLTVFSFHGGSLELIQPALVSMTSLERLILPEDIRWCDDGLVSVEDLKVLAQVPFMGNLTELSMSLFNFEDEHSLINPDFTAPLVSLFQKATNLKCLALGGTSNWQFYEDAPLKFLEDLHICACLVPTSFTLPRSLLHLKFECLELGSPEEFLEIFKAVGNFPQLKTLEMDYVCHRHDDDDDWPLRWTDAIPKLNMPKIESITLKSCRGLSESDAFLIAEAAPNIPKLKKYSVDLEFDKSQNPVSFHRVLKFFSSSLAATLEDLELHSINLGYIGFRGVVENSSNMKRLKTLKLRCVTIRNATEREMLMIIHKLNLPKVESITFDYCKGFSANEAFRIAEAGPNIPNLKKLFMNLEINGRFPDVRLVKKLCTSSLAAKLESLTLWSNHLGYAGCREVMENASNMKCLKSLEFYVDGLREVLMIALSGAAGGWPMLQKLTLYISKEEPLRKNEYWLKYCKALFDPIWPNLEIDVP